MYPSLGTLARKKLIEPFIVFWPRVVGDLLKSMAVGQTSQASQQFASVCGKQGNSFRPQCARESREKLKQIYQKIGFWPPFTTAHPSLEKWTMTTKCHTLWRDNRNCHYQCTRSCYKHIRRKKSRHGRIHYREFRKHSFFSQQKFKKVLTFYSRHVQPAGRIRPSRRFCAAQ